MRAVRWLWLFSKATCRCINHALRKGKSITWNVIVADAFVNSYIASTSVEAGAAAEIAAERKKSKYMELAQKHVFIPLACQVTGVWCSEACDFLNELGSRICKVTRHIRETSHTCFDDSLSLYRRATLHVLIIFQQPLLKLYCREHSLDRIYFIIGIAQCYNAPRNEILLAKK